MSFVISPEPSLPTGTQIRNVADITFDSNAPVATDLVNDEDPSEGVDPNKQALISIDNTVPTSSITALPATESSKKFTVRWSGSDGNGSGIAKYDVYVSDDGGAFKPFLTDTTKTSATFKGEDGHTYRFYSVATSNVGFVQPTPSDAQAKTTVHIQALTHSHSPTPTPTPTPPPPHATSTPLVTVTGVQDVTNKKHHVTEILVTFSGAVNASEAQDLSIYHLATPGKHGSYTVKNAKVIKLRSAVYDGADDTVTLFAMKPFALSKPVQIRIDGGAPLGLQDIEGRYIDGADNGGSGSNTIVVLSRGGATIDAVVLGTASRSRVPILAVVDALLDRDALVGLRHAPRTVAPHVPRSRESR